jgi:type IV pilus assembly protein PilN
MIKINLLGEETVSDTSGHGLIAGYVSSIVLAVLLGFFFRMSIVGEIAEFKQTRDALERDLRVLKQTTAEVRELEKRRDELKAKLTVIALLKKSKAGPVHVMDAINSAIPERAWVLDVREKARDMTIQGMALDNISVSDLAKQLMASEFFQNVEIVETKTAAWKDAMIRQFTIKARVNYAGRILPVDSGSQSAAVASSGGAASSSQGASQAASAVAAATSSAAASVGGGQ